MNDSVVPTYTIPTDSYLCSAIITTFLSIIGFIPNVYFFIKSFTYEGFYNRPTFRIMIMFLSFEYVIGIVIHVIFSTYYMSHYYLSIPLHVNTCSKLRIIDINWNELIIVTPLYFNIIRFFKIVLQRKVNYIFLLIVIILTLGPLVYLTTGQLFEINSYYVPKVGCNYDIYSDIPLFTSLLFINLYMLMAIPVIALIINCSIYFYVIRIKENFAVAYAIEQKKLFQGIAVQSILPLLGQLPVLFIMLLQTKYYYTPLCETVIIESIYVTSQIICVFFSLLTINDFRKMILKDLKCKTIKVTPNSVIKSSNIKFIK